jgi:hypothetical protein
MSVSTVGHQITNMGIGQRGGQGPIGELRFNPRSQTIQIMGRNPHNGLIQWLDIRGENNLRFVKAYRLKDKLGHSYIPSPSSYRLLEMIRIEEEARSLAIDEVIYELDRMGHPERDIHPPKLPGVFILAKGVSDFQLNHALAAVK